MLYEIFTKCNSTRYAKCNKKSLRNVIPTHNVIRNFHEMLSCRLGLPISNWSGHVVCHDCYFQNQTSLLYMLPQIGRIHPIQLTPLKAHESLIAKYIQATSLPLANDIRENLQRIPDANQSKNTRK